jgi:hypothetical protein
VSASPRDERAIVAKIGHRWIWLPRTADQYVKTKVREVVVSRSLSALAG